VLHVVRRAWEKFIRPPAAAPKHRFPVAMRLDSLVSPQRAKNARRTLCFAAALLTGLPGMASAQLDTTVVAGPVVAADTVEWIPYAAPNSDDEIYLRYLQMTGSAASQQWSLRGFSPRELRRLAVRAGAHPWTGAGSFVSADEKAWLLPVSAEVRGNSAFPHGGNDGPVWAGRGLTVSVAVGAHLRLGPVSLVLNPTAFIAQNASFELMDNGQPGSLRFADGQYFMTVDRPQRFGDGAYGAVDPGNSTLRADVGALSAGISTANLAWGPFELYPFVLGTNAAGFPHGFVGTGRPVNVGVGSLHARVIWGRLDQSDYSPVEGEPTYVSPADVGTRRFASGLLVMLQPRGMPGLELGIARFFHSPWPREGIPPSYVTKPFENILKHRLRGSPNFRDPGTSAENQLLSGFARWVFPTAGFEMYGEYGREDHSWDRRDFAQEPDHSRSYGLGFRKVVRLRPDRMEGLTFELMNFDLPHLVRTGRGEGSIYVHGIMRQGHTHRGQLLGADVGVGAASGSTIRWDRYAPRGRTTIGLHRAVRRARGTFFGDAVIDPGSREVHYTVEAARMRRLRGMEVTAELGLTHAFNRDYRSDATNFSAILSARIPLGR